MGTAKEPNPPLHYPEVPKIPEEVEKLLALQIATRSVGQMRSVIALAAVAVTLGAAGLGYKIVDLNSALVSTRLKADSLDLRASELATDLKSSALLQSRLSVEAKNDRQQSREDFAALVTHYQAVTLLTLQEAVNAQQRAGEAQATVGAARNDVENLQEQNRAFREGVNMDIAHIAQRDSLSALSVTAMDNRVFGTWTVVLDQGRPFKPVGDSNLNARALQIHSSRDVEVEVEENSPQHLLLCGHAFKIELGGAARRCPLGDSKFEISAIWAMKQGLSLIPFVGNRYPDRAAIQVTRVMDQGAGNRVQVPVGMSKSPVRKPKLR